MQVSKASASRRLTAPADPRPRRPPLARRWGFARRPARLSRDEGFARGAAGVTHALLHASFVAWSARGSLPAVAVGLVALGIAGCSAGQVSQTDQMEPAVNGTSADVGAIALRNIVVAYPATDSYRAGGDAPLTLAIVNTGGTDDKLTAVSSPAAGTVELVGDASVPARSALAVVVPEEPATSSPAEPTESAPSSSASSSSTTERPPRSPARSPRPRRPLSRPHRRPPS